ncbi:hypothetical protein [Streptomyces sp. NPDC102264]|uniref:hypothetical protein n=1 Tax=Streptomyces sp. NPDC102264 TaxID=3366149 RepID=UPI00382AD740
MNTPPGGSFCRSPCFLAPAESFDEETGPLHLRSVSPAYRTQIDLYQRRITAKSNAIVGDDTVRHASPQPPGRSRLRKCQYGERKHPSMP